MRATLTLAAALFAAVFPVQSFAQEAPASIANMTAAAQAFTVSLSEDQKTIALKDFADRAEREKFIPVPFPTTGLRFDAMSEDQIQLAHGLLKSGLSAVGYDKASQIIQLDDYLVEIESLRGRAPKFHGSQNYNVAIFGTPTADGTWAWRFHGHHLFIAITIVDGKLAATAPAFFGAEPHDVTEGPRAPWRILADEEDLGSGLFTSLDPHQKEQAVVADKMPGEMVSGDASRVEPFADAGIGYSDLTPAQQAKLQELVLEYVYNSPEDLQHERLDRVESGGWENTRFAWVGVPERGQRNYYRVQGPLFLIEYCATALTPNHIHTVWRDYNGDFGRDLLADHLASEPH